VLADTPAQLKRVTPVPGRIAVPVVDLLRRPDGPRDRQLLFGEPVSVLETLEGFSFIQSDKDGYVGYVPEHAVAEPIAATHRVTAPATHLYPQPDFKQHELAALSYGSLLRVTGTSGHFAETPMGYVPSCHIASIGDLAQDPVSIAELFLGTPYLWGGNSRWGIDCSGLVQTALIACGQPCPGDSDMQEREVGALLVPDSAPQRGDLLFWKGHVAMVCDPETLIHANAHHMAVVHEGLKDAIQRIAAQGDGPVTAHRRP
jgi:cell wall-associated NlpC family hydrolase